MTCKVCGGQVEEYRRIELGSSVCMVCAQHGHSDVTPSSLNSRLYAQSNVKGNGHGVVVTHRKRPKLLVDMIED